MRSATVLALVLILSSAGGRASAAAAPTVKPLSAEQQQQVRETVAEVLAQPEFRHVHDKGRKWREWLWEKLSGLCKWLRDWLWGLPSWLSWLIVIWLALTLLAILAHLAYVIITQFGGGRGPWVKHTRATGRLATVCELEFDTLLAEARRHLDAGEWLAAVRYLYVASILWLDRQGWVHFRESKTNGDYIRELAPHAGAQQCFRSLTRTFDGIVYGGTAPSEETCRAMAASFESMRSEAGPADKA
ncbi:MAG: DUF4129 domain-containing protein [Phycisphaerae bacterium]|jgi:hypothetical protein